MRKIMAATMGAGAVAAALVVSAPAGAAQAESADVYCLMQQGETTCVRTAAAFSRMAPAASSHVLTLWQHDNYEGGNAKFYRGEGDCSPESDFNPPDDSWAIPPLTPGGTRKWVSSVRKIDAGHCNWRLFGDSGGVSTEVENDIPNLDNLGSGWDNRAIGVQVD